MAGGVGGGRAKKSPVVPTTRNDSGPAAIVNAEFDTVLNENKDTKAALAGANARIEQRIRR